MQQTGYRNRLAVAACFSTMFLLGVGVALLGPSLPGIAAHLGVSLAAAGILFTLYAGGSLLATLALARLVDTPARRVLLIGGSLLLAAMLWLFTASTRLAWSGAAIAVAGFALSAGGIAPNVLIAEIYGDQAPGRLNALHMVSAIGSFCGPLAVGLALQLGSDYTVIFRGLAILEVGAAILWLLASPPLPRRAQPAPFSLAWLQPIVLLVVLAVLYVGSEQTVGGWTFAYARQIAGFDAAAAGAATSVFWLAMIGGRLVATRILHRLACVPVLVLAVLLGGFGIALALLAPFWPALLWAGAAVTGLAFGPIFPTTLAQAMRTEPQRMGVISSLLVAAGSVGTMALPPAAGALIPYVTIRGTLAAVEVPLALMLLCLWLLAHAGRRPA